MQKVQRMLKGHSKPQDELYYAVKRVVILAWRLLALIGTLYLFLILVLTESLSFELFIRHKKAPRERRAWED